MGQIKCDYCGSFFSDTQPNCPSCGAVNSAYKRTATGTPRTIQELKQWYIDHHLPPEDVTRFYIGKNVHHARAFGIYTDGRNFTVYKNKADGTRAIRYQGTDEAYAVNELYLRLKEEILNQRGHNQAVSAAKASRAAYSANNSSSYHTGTQSAYRSSSNYGRSYPKRAKKRAGKKALYWGIGIAALAFGAKISNDYDAKTAYTAHYYETADEKLYYMDFGPYLENSDYGYGWWRYDEFTGEWVLDLASNSSEEFPESLILKDQKGKELYPTKVELGDYANEHGATYSDYSIYNSHRFIDYGNHITPGKYYYQLNNTLYYYLNDNYGANYGNGDNSGWYRYDDDAESWTYYCSKDDKDVLGDELWYDPDDYIVGSTYTDVYDFADQNDLNWSMADFDDSVWGEEYNAAYDNYYESSKNNSSSNSDYNYSYDYDDDDDYDWDWGNDYDYDWDSGWSDWDSDW